MYYQIKAKYEQAQEQGTIKSVSEQIVVEGEMFGDVERAAIPLYCGEMASAKSGLTNGAYDIKAIARANYSRIIGNVTGLVEHGENGKVNYYEPEKDANGKWFKCRTSRVTIAESGRETKETTHYLVGASSVEGAHKALSAHIAQWPGEEIESVDETKVVDVYLLKSSVMPDNITK